MAGIRATSCNLSDCCISFCANLPLITKTISVYLEFYCCDSVNTELITSVLLELLCFSLGD